MSSIKIKFDSIYGLGDQLATVYSLENFGRQKKIKSYICGGLGEYITNIFQLEFVLFEKNETNSMLNRKVNSKPYLKNYPKSGYAHYIVRLLNLLASMGYNHYETEPLKLKEKIIEKQPKNMEVLGQFDSRFAKRHNFEINEIQISRILKTFLNKEKITMIGGKETKKYKDHNYFLGNLKELTSMVATSKKFIGVDSGMSHLAGVLGIESHVVLLLPYWYAKSNLKKENYNICYYNNTDAQPSLIEYYKSYKNNKCYGREIFEKIKYI
jgi:ADP-heptose:LPS heptosyltransferase